ncbi:MULTISPECIES: ABC transporter substrate-binding protein [unclassified Pseudomonas]|uniref:ABC transporter substrate-binding protein n=1 Tax=unclassified Pseudomonas TaxID=196821 RepID=UPI0025F6098C|nr:MULTISPECIES: ABC transporter substrate-binding protein [unclassified Pseudomonas]
MMRLGICAALDVGTTLHARSFLRGVYLSNHLFSHVRRAQHLYFDDGASAEGGRAAAERFIEAGVDAVIGHFASDSAAAVAESYAQAGIPLILPASTSAALTAAGSTTFRICASDRLLAKRLLDFAEHAGLHRLALFADPSLHGQRQLHELRNAVDSSGDLSTVKIVTDPGQADALVFCGRLKASHRFLVENRAAGCELPLFFTDDAASPALISGLDAPGTVYVVSFPVAADLPEAQSVDLAYQQMYGTSAPVYVIETLAAFSLVELAARQRRGLLDALRFDEFSTPAGPVRFNDGENSHARVSLWIYADKRVHERRLLY